MCELLWKGEIHVDDLKWELVRKELRDFIGNQYDDVLHAREMIWEELLEKYEVYNGDLIAVSHFKRGKFSCFHYSFKDHVTMSSLGIKLKGLVGNLGFKLHVYNRDRSKILIGQRSQNSEYMQGYLSSIGGMFELRDINSKVSDAILRELNEEAGISRKDLDWLTFKIIALQKEENGLAIDMVAEVTLKENVDLTPNEEWESLYWHDCTKKVIGEKVMSHLIHFSGNY